jgi:hypothetical protein
MAEGWTMKCLRFIVSFEPDVLSMGLNLLLVVALVSSLVKVRIIKMIKAMCSMNQRIKFGERKMEKAIFQAPGRVDPLAMAPNQLLSTQFANAREWRALETIRFHGLDKHLFPHVTLPIELAKLGVMQTKPKCIIMDIQIGKSRRESFMEPVIMVKFLFFRRRLSLWANLHPTLEERGKAYLH